MATSTLPLAADQDPFQHITIVNRRTEDLTVNVQALDRLNDVVSGSITIRPAASATFQSDGINQWWTISSGKPNAVVHQLNATGLPVLVPAAPTWLTLTGTEFSIPYHGVWHYGGTITFDVTGVPGNQYWDVDLELYDSTAAQTIAHLDFSGAGNPDIPIRDSWSVMAANLQVGNAHYLRVSRASITGDVYVDVCETEMTGPI